MIIAPARSAPRFVLLRRVRRIGALLLVVGANVASLGAAEPAKAEPTKTAVFVSVGQVRMEFRPLNRRVEPTPTQPHYYVPEHRIFGRVATPPAWLIAWTESYLAGKGFIAADKFTPALRLIFDWGPLDPLITHIGSPAQSLDMTGRILIDARFSTYGGSRTTPFCVVWAFETKGEAAAKIEERIWRMEMWFAFVRPRPRGEVEIGHPTVVEEAVELPMPSGENPPPPKP